jgi:hypothetical protein
MRPVEWTTNVIAKRGLSKPDGRPLYQYRFDDEEYAALAEMLKLSAQLGINNLTKMLSWNAALVMYATEWWRREYSGAWGWDGIFGSLGINYAELSVNRRNELVETGLRFWQREVRVTDGTRKFLGTIATEGGLPLHQLAGSGGWLKQVLNPAINRHLSRGIDLRLLIASYELFIPRSFRSPEINQILADIADSVVSLRTTHHLDSKPSPLEWLDENQPSWRESFPLPVEEGVIKLLLGELIRTAANAAVKDLAGNPFELERILRSPGTPMQEIVATIVLPAFISTRAFGDLADSNLLTTNLDIEIFEPGGKVWPWCRAIPTLRGDLPVLKLTGKTLSLRGADAQRELRVRLKSLGEIVYEGEIINGEPLDETIPWLFRETTKDWILHGTASQAVKDEEVIAYLPYESNISLDGDPCDEDRLPFLSGSTIRFSGRLSCQVDDDFYLLSTKAPGENNVSFSLAGTRFSGSSLPTQTFLGAPQLRETNVVTGVSRRNRNLPLLAKHLGEDLWRPIDNVGAGCFMVRLQNREGQTLFRRRIGMLPVDFEYHLEPSVSSVREGRVTLNNTDSFECSVPDTALGAIVSQAPNQIDIQLAAADEPPLGFLISLQKQGRAHQGFQLELPFPAGGVQLYGPDNKMLPDSTKLFLDSLMGYRVRFFNSNQSGNQNVDLIFQLEDFEMNRDEIRDIYIKRSLRLSGGVSEFSLYDWRDAIEALMGISKSLDAKVQIQIVHQGAEKLRLRVITFENRMVPNWELQTVELSQSDMARLGSDQLGSMTVSAFSLLQPEQADVSLSSIVSSNSHVGAWDLDTSKCTDGPWMVYPTAESPVKFRPLIWNVGDFDSNEVGASVPIDSLQKAIQLSDQSQRLEAIRMILSEMAIDAQHKGWRYLFNLWEKSGHLPMTTFDVWKVGVSQHTFLATLLLNENSGITEKLAIELLVIWELVSVDDWKQAFATCRAKLQEQTDDDKELVAELMLKRIEKISQLSASMNSIGKLLALDILGVQSNDLRAMAMPDITVKPVIEDAYQNLMRRQANNEWPQFLSGEIQADYRAIPKVFREFFVIHHTFQNSVSQLPWVLAWRTVNNLDLGVVPSELFKISQLKGFDEDWFSTTYALLVGWMSLSTEGESI